MTKDRDQKNSEKTGEERSRREAIKRIGMGTALMAVVPFQGIIASKNLSGPSADQLDSYYSCAYASSGCYYSVNPDIYASMNYYGSTEVYNAYNSQSGYTSVCCYHSCSTDYTSCDYYSYESN